MTELHTCGVLGLIALLRLCFLWVPLYFLLSLCVPDLVEDAVDFHQGGPLVGVGLQDHGQHLYEILAVPALLARLTLPGAL